MNLKNGPASDTPGVRVGVGFRASGLGLAATKPKRTGAERGRGTLLKDFKNFHLHPKGNGLLKRKS
ncbi:hypothetical protein T484DRAFT_1932940 [Baffinella frigidus]|nr:hypothetical protein T484DRAFT_1932940 [Cryptophyta sp. CCMP2293]